MRVQRALHSCRAVHSGRDNSRLVLTSCREECRGLPLNIPLTPESRYLPVRLDLHGKESAFSFVFIADLPHQALRTGSVKSPYRVSPGCVFASEARNQGYYPRRQGHTTCSKQQSSIRSIVRGLVGLFQSQGLEPSLCLPRPSCRRLKYCTI